MPTSMPVACEVYYKLRTDKIQESRLGATLSGEDYNALLEGKQNIGKFPVEFDPSNELYDLFYRSLNENGEGTAVGFDRTIIRAKLTKDGPLDPLVTSFRITIANPVDALAIKAGSPIQIGNEILVVSRVVSGNPIILDVETRGDHGTEIEGHLTGDTVILLRYSVPHNTIKLDGFLDSSLPLRVIKFILSNTVDPLDSGIEIETQLPDSQIKTLRSIQIQLSTTLWPENLSNVTGLKGIRAQGVDGEVTQGGTSLTTQTSLSGFEGKYIYTHEGINLVTGEISFGRCVVIDNVVDNGGGSWTANVTGDWVFRLRLGAEGVSRTINWIVADDWLTPGNTPTWVADKVTEIKNSTGFPGDPLVLNTHRETIITGASVYARCRLVNWLGVGPWTYWNGVIGSADRADAILFSPGIDTTVPSMATVEVRSIKLNVFINIGPLAQPIKGYNYFRFYRIKIHLDAARTNELLSATTPEHSQRDRDAAASFNFQVPVAGDYWYTVIPVNSLGDGVATLGTFFVTGLAPTLADGVPGAPSVIFKELLQEGLGASYTLGRPATGYSQIGLYTAVVRDNNSFDFVYSGTNFMAALNQNSDDLVATTDVFSMSSVGKLIDLTGIDTGNVSGQRHLFIVTKYVSERVVKIHRTWWGSNQVGLSAKIGDPWWSDSHTLWHQSLFVVGPTAVASPIEESFDFAVPIQGKTIYVSAFATSIFGMSIWATTPIGVTTETFSSLVKKYESATTPPSVTPRHALAWTTNIKMRPVDKDTIRWDAGNVKFSDGVTQTVASTGSPKTLSPASNDGVWYVYKLFNSSTIRFTQNYSTAIGSSRIQLGIVVVSADDGNDATVLIKGDSGGPHISAQSIAVNTLSALTGNIGEVTSGTITGVLIRSARSGQRIQMTSPADAVGHRNLLEVFNATHIAGQLGIFADPRGNLGNLFYMLSKGSNRDLGMGSERAVYVFTNTIDNANQFRGKFEVFAKEAKFTLGSGGFLQLDGGDLRKVGDVALDSLTKDGAGHIDVRSDVDFNSKRILNAVFETAVIADIIPNVTLTADDRSITSGQSVILTWTSGDAVSVSISQSIGSVTPVSGGTRTVNPTNSRTYTATATSSTGHTSTASVRITVSARPPARPTINYFRITPRRFVQGQSVTFSWSCSNTTTVNVQRLISGTWVTDGVRGPSGSETSSATSGLLGDYINRIQAIGPGGSRNGSRVTYTVTAA